MVISTLSIVFPNKNCKYYTINSHSYVKFQTWVSLNVYLSNLKKLLLTCCPGVYLYILNLEQHHRSQSNNYLIVQIFKNSHLKDFSVEECFGQLVNDINSLITNGIDISLGKSYPVRFAQYRSILIRA